MKSSSSGVEVDQDGFILVKSKRKTSNGYVNQKKTSPQSFENIQNKEIDKEYCLSLLKKTQSFMEQLKMHDSHLYCQKFQHLLRQKVVHSLNQLTDIKKSLKIICYGLGSVDDNLSSRHQLALLILFIEDIKIHFNEIEIDEIEVYDPLFNQNDLYLLENLLKFNVPRINTQCMRNIDNSSTTIFYMPHCPKSLYNNVLYSNWSPSLLNKIIIIGNSFKSLAFNYSGMESNYGFLNDSLNFLNETQLDFECEFSLAFYGQSIHQFEVNNINKNNNNKNLFINNFNKLEPIIYKEDDEII
jgi:hypothetical protein